jgi:hypothetical protein
MCRQIDGCAGNVSEIFQGTKGVLYTGGDSPYMTDLEGNEIWRYDRATAEAAYTQNNPYVLEHVNLIASIRSGQPVNQAEETAISTLAGIMGRDAAYTGAKVTWDEESAKTHGIVIEDPKLENLDMSKYTVPVPGTAK